MKRRSASLIWLKLNLEFDSVRYPVDPDPTHHEHTPSLLLHLGDYFIQRGILRAASQIRIIDVFVRMKSYAFRCCLRFEC